ncbi:MAG: hypothetical protein ACPGVX_01135 [Thalassobaculaceae bacterium]
MAKMVKAQALALLRNAISDIVDDPDAVAEDLLHALTLERQSHGPGPVARHDLTPATWRRRAITLH